MSKYEVLTAFNDLENSGKHIAVGEIIELSEERYIKMVDNANFFGGIEMFLKPVTIEDVETDKKGKKKK